MSKPPLEDLRAPDTQQQKALKADMFNRKQREPVCLPQAIAFLQIRYGQKGKPSNWELLPESATHDLTRREKSTLQQGRFSGPELGFRATWGIERDVV